MQQEQSHLDYRDTINYGSYYTPENIVSLTYALLHKNVSDISTYTLVDTSCGYGSFLTFPHSIGADCDKTALAQAARNNKDCRFICHNSLYHVCRASYGFNGTDRLIIIGNPPYNDRTSLIRNGIKQESCQVDMDLRHRDLGISFLLSYDKLRADYICALHPLSYLIKKANFNSLGNFRKHYRLIDALIINSGEFSATSRTTQFPIIIALYQRHEQGMEYDAIRNYLFTTKEGRNFSINQFDYLSNYITKYPNQNCVRLEDTAAFFWTMRDINALRRTRSFIEKEGYNSIRVAKDKLAFYCYADIFKRYTAHIPYYFGNSDIMIDCAAFERLQDIFISKSLRNYVFLKHLAPVDNNSQADFLIQSYFQTLLGEHYANKQN